MCLHLMPNLQPHNHPKRASASTLTHAAHDRAFSSYRSMARSGGGSDCESSGSDCLRSALHIGHHSHRLTLRVAVAAVHPRVRAEEAPVLIGAPHLLLGPI